MGNGASTTKWLETPGSREAVFYIPNSGSVVLNEYHKVWHYSNEIII